jgi:hypothetical protein
MPENYDETIREPGRHAPRPTVFNSMALLRLPPRRGGAILVFEGIAVRKYIFLFLRKSAGYPMKFLFERAGIGSPVGHLSAEVRNFHHRFIKKSKVYSISSIIICLFVITLEYSLPNEA